jgi:hypothetical protein
MREWLANGKPHSWDTNQWSRRGAVHKVTIHDVGFNLGEGGAVGYVGGLNEGQMAPTDNYFILS